MTIVKIRYSLGLVYVEWGTGVTHVYRTSSTAHDIRNMMANWINTVQCLEPVVGAGGLQYSLDDFEDF